MDYLPSTKFIKTVGTIFGVILGGWLVFYSINRFGFPANDKLTPEEILSVRAYDTLAQDADNDGLKDWEEAIWTTDPKNADTDGDGTTDGDEVKIHRDPAITNTASAEKTPNDFVLGYESGVATANNRASSTVTQQLSNDFLTRYFVTKGLSDGAQLDAQQKSDLQNSFVQNFEKQAIDRKDEFTEKDVLVSTIKSPKEYINDLGRADSIYYKGLTKLELDIFKDVMSSQDVAKLKELDAYIVALTKHIAFLKKEEVPARYAGLHLELLNIVNNSKYADEKMRNLENDPLGAIVGAKYFGEQVIRFEAVLKKLKEQIDNDKLTFNNSEYGAQFYKNLPSK